MYYTSPLWRAYADVTLRVVLKGFFLWYCMYSVSSGTKILKLRLMWYYILYTSSISSFTQIYFLIVLHFLRRHLIRVTKLGIQWLAPSWICRYHTDEPSYSIWFDTKLLIVDSRFIFTTVLPFIVLVVVNCQNIRGLGPWFFITSELCLEHSTGRMLQRSSCSDLWMWGTTES